MKSITIARQEVKLLAREKTILLLLVIFLCLTLASTFIGWFAQGTIQKVFLVAADELRVEGKTVPPSPFSNLPDLIVVKNVMIYIVLCGALLAIVLGYSAGMHDRKAGSVKILFSHPINKRDYLFGKILGISFVLLLMMLIALLISIVSSAILVKITGLDILRLIGFYGFSFIYLLGFAILGLAFALIIKNDAIALLIPIILWLTITFVLPEFTSALYPTASLNPVLPPIETHGPILDLMHSIVNPFSISEHYKDSGAYILNLKDSFSNLISSGKNIYNLFLMLSWSLLCLLFSFIAIKKFNAAEGDLNE
jgi:ABC-2 type transport system permease protein